MKRTWVIVILAIVIGSVAVFLRLRGIFWGEYQYLHPDERFLVWVGTDISPVNSLKEYWDTANSSLNPHNRGHGFYVYGTLPMFLTRYVVEWVYGHSGFLEMTNVGRVLSTLADLFTILFVYLVAKRLYDWRVGLLAAAFSAFSVLQIQHSHFFTMDTFITFFALLTIYFAVLAMQSNGNSKATSAEITGQSFSEENLGQLKEKSSSVSPHNFQWFDRLFYFISKPLFLLSIGFGISLGLAVASKINAAPLAFLFPAVLLIRLKTHPEPVKSMQIKDSLVYLGIAAIASLVVFRIFQPYAFSGPGFFGLMPNQAWIANLREIRNQTTGDVDFPPAIQWARRPLWFAWQNMVLWGMGLPLGLLSWLGFLYIGRDIYLSWRKKNLDWAKHILLWVWVAFYFSWQSLPFNPSLRYQLPIYPALIIFAAHVLVAVFDRFGTTFFKGFVIRIVNLRFTLTSSGLRLVIILVAVLSLVATGVYAFAFSSIYDRPITRIEASRWIYQNIPGAINLHIQTNEGQISQPLSYPYDYIIRPQLPYITSFTPRESGSLSEVYVAKIYDPTLSLESQQINIEISDALDGSGINTIAIPMTSEPQVSLPSKVDQKYGLEQPFIFQRGETYYLRLILPNTRAGMTLSGVIIINIQGDSETVEQSIAFEDLHLSGDAPTVLSVTAQVDGLVTLLQLIPKPKSEQLTETALELVLSDQPGAHPPLVSASIIDRFPSRTQYQGSGYIFKFDNPLEISAGHTYYLGVNIVGDDGAVVLAGSALANDGHWDDPLPVRVDNHDGFGGIYQGLNFDMYEDDNPAKLARFFTILDQADYVIISSNRQWGSLPRIPERFPMNTEYFRSLLGCSPGKKLEWCYSVAKPGFFQGELGFELVKVFQSNPQMGPFQVNDQFAEEAFTVYDHPKVFIFKKLPEYSPQTVQDILGKVDLSQVIHVTPKNAGQPYRNSLLPVDKLNSQQAGGTWSTIFNHTAMYNRYPVIGLLLWYLALALLGFIIYPLIRYLFPGLPDRGYPLARISGLLILSYLVWLLGSLGIPSNRLTITIVLVLLSLVFICFVYKQRDELLIEWQSKRVYFFIIEGLFLAFFTFDILIRFGNPDLWHPWKGGEKPMDFSYLNAVLKSTTFPPYDPWFAGGYINYYYYGFVLVGVLVKWLGIVPSIAYNLILPSVFAMIAMGAFSVGWNIFASQPKPSVSKSIKAVFQSLPFRIGLFSAMGMAVLGNLGTVRMIFQGYQRLAAPGGIIEGSNILNRWVWAIKGLWLTFQGEALPYALADWYWLPSRAIPAPNDIEPITEFPFFTVLYGDPHAHLFALPLTLLAMTWALSVILGKAWLLDRTTGPFHSWYQVTLGVLFGGLVIGSLRPTNTWDLPTYLLLSILAVGYASWRYYQPGLTVYLSRENAWYKQKRIVFALTFVIFTVGVSIWLFQPYASWYVQGYTAFDIWRGTHTPIWSYLTHWGLFLFMIVSWMLWETRDWMAKTPISALNKLRPYRLWIIFSLLLIMAGVLFLLKFGIGIGWFVLPIIVWGGLLLLKSGLPEMKRVVLILVEVGLVLTLLVELFVLRGDIGRMNTVFKFYLQVWTIFSISSAAAFGWLLTSLADWSPSWRFAWKASIVILITSASLYTLMGGLAKIKDRMVTGSPHTLDGMEFMRYAFYDDLNTTMDLSQDYAAIRWLQDNVSGSPVIVEANMPEYHWGTRFTIYTGLPNVIGWNWHQRQQRAMAVHELVPQRVSEVSEFYLTDDQSRAKAFLDKYDVRYVIVGQLERAYYPREGLEKFEMWDGLVWLEVFRYEDTVVYEVIQ